MKWVVQTLWLVPVLPLLAAGVIAIRRQPHRKFAAALSIGAMTVSFLLSCFAFAATLQEPRLFYNFSWFPLGDTALRLGWVLDPLSASMLVMVTFVGTLIFIYSVGYMAHDPNFTRFFCFLSLFAAAMLGLVMANSLLLLFICWELVGVASYLLIGFWYHKPSAAAAAKKAFIVTRIGDLGLFLGMLWLYSASGTLLFYDGGNGCLEQNALARLLPVSTAISLLIFCGAVGKSGQVPLHVWLPDAMEGPTPVSALIHAATMVAAGVFLMARVYPLLSPAALSVVTWVGAITAVFAALIAVAQTDIKRILAYSTVSQLGYMMLGIGVGGYAVGMFHLITHAFFKALLFLGAGSVIHGVHERQDIREMGGIKRSMRITFLTYAIGMMALSGVPFFFSGFWSKDEILLKAFEWPASRWPFYLAAFGAFLTAFYMTRQMWYVFFGKPRTAEEAHESPSVMTTPLIILAVAAVLLSLIGTPFWPWFHSYLTGHLDHAHFTTAIPTEALFVMLISIIIVACGIGLAAWFYSRQATTVDVLQRFQPDIFYLFERKFFIDELYESSVVKVNAIFARGSHYLDRFVFESIVMAVGYVFVGLSWVSRLIDEFVVNLGFDKGCGSFKWSGKLLSFWQNGQVQRYLRFIGIGAACIVLVLIWGCRA